MACNKCYQKSTLEAYSVVSQELAVDQSIEFDGFTQTGTSIKLAGNTGVRLAPGLYQIIVNASAGGTGTVTLQLFRNGVAIPNAIGSGISAGPTNLVPLSLGNIIDVKRSCKCVDNTTLLTIKNVGVAATMADINVDIVKLA